ncbi:MAG TPA: hypothetical protein VK390_00855 [Propionibacteriaceae bacterium]|nr:hypothetical protein [Propionibacteriaceae bacterium]
MTSSELRRARNSGDPGTPTPVAYGVIAFRLRNKVRRQLQALRMMVVDENGHKLQLKIDHADLTYEQAAKLLQGQELQPKAKEQAAGLS